MQSPPASEIPWYRSLRVGLTALVLGAAVLLILVLGWAYREQEQRIVEAGKEEVLRVATFAAAEHGQVLQRGEELLTVLARLQEIREARPGCAATLGDLIATFPVFANVGVADADGRVLCSALPAPEDVSVAERDWFQEALRTRGAAVGGYQIGMLTRRPTLNLGLGVNGAAEAPARVLFVALDLGAFAERLAAVGRDGLVVLLDTRGTILTRSEEAERWQGKSAVGTPLWSAILGAPGGGTAAVPGIDGIPRLFGFHPVRTHGQAAAVIAYGIRQADLFSETRALFGRTLLGLSVAVAIFLGLLWLSGGFFLLRRLDALRRQAARIAGGDLSARLNVRSSDEVGQLARAFDAMADEVARAITHREDFVSIAAHELRAPLSNLSARLQLLQRELGQQPPNPAAAAQNVTAARAQVQRLARLIDTLLEVSRLREHRLELKQEAVELADVVRTTVETMAPQAADAGCALSVDVPGGLVGQWDRMRLEQVVTNLLSNAIKFGAGKPVELSAARQDHEALLRVRDHGIGMTAEDAGRVFGRFERAVAEGRYSGLGLGLYITREIVTAHGGSIAVSTAPGQGAEFVVRLPLTATAPASSSAAR